MKDFDVYAYGVISSSELHLLSTPFPPPDAYAKISRTHFMTGGETLNSALVLSRLGFRVQLDGNWFGDTPAGERLLEIIQSNKIDTKRLNVKKVLPESVKLCSLTNKAKPSLAIISIY